METDLVTTLEFDKALLTAAIAALGPLDGAKVDLFVNDVTPNRNTVLGDLTSPGYTGHAAQTVVFGAVSEADDGSAECIGAAKTFRPTDALGTTSVAYGMKFFDSGASVLYGATRFDGAPLTMGAPSDVTVVVPRLRVVDGKVVVVS